MRSDTEVREVFRLAERGLSKSEIARLVGIARATVRDWLTQGEEVVLNRPMRQASAGRCSEDRDGMCTVVGGLHRPAYAYLLGQYLGDGCISRIGSAWRLRISCCDAYPGIILECTATIEFVKPGARVGYVQRQGCTEVYATWVHWPCLFPHGAGVKHLRPIVLTPWQREIALDGFPEMLIRGLIHSDGWRGTNRVRGSNGLPYAYPRYQFTNRSEDIRRLFVEACDRVGVETRRMNEYNISVAKRDSVALLDEFVGPKE